MEFRWSCKLLILLRWILRSLEVVLIKVGLQTYYTSPCSDEFLNSTSVAKSSLIFLALLVGVLGFQMITLPRISPFSLNFFKSYLVLTSL